MSRTDEITAKAERYILPTYARYPIVLKEGRGCRLTDEEGKDYLDFLSGLAVNALGYRHPSLVRVMQDMAEGLWHTSNFFHSESQARLAERLVAATGMSKVFFNNTGTESVETAIKIAKLAGGPERTEFVAAENGFHGRTLGALSATHKEKYRKPFEPLVPGFGHVPYGDADAMEAAITERTAGVILEPVQGEGGIRPAPDGYLDRVQALCRDRGALFIADEIQSGVGRTGTFLAVERYGVLPDIVCLAKALGAGLPLGATLVRGRAAEVFAPGHHGTTFGGNLLACRMSLALMDEVQRPGFLESVRLCGSVLGKKLAEAVEGIEGVKEVRGAGMMWGIEFQDERASRVVDTLRDKGVLASVAGPTVLRLLPPLVLSPDEAEEGAAILKEVLKETSP